ncbi:CmpA/NrtA family ABC transporter substrate-binding protein [Acidimangrovimonas sediminis]|uniref:CmpA/NrtA family ABC transporter substrate-binding protein n=1 Tax=Acidimangrovimonas sediminis TaxID=2056283 RepID=UPI000C806535|nr:CmpA/NrtA family ABC transporter substrate-binding protein [Acidimangrovimonas sediminis]
MSADTLRAGFIPLVDAAPLIVAREVGFAEEEGLALDLAKAPSWATLRDMLAYGQIEAAHMLSVVPVAMEMGLGGAPARIDVLQVMSVNGDAICVSRALADKMRAAGHGFDFADATDAGRALIAVAGDRPRIGVPFPFSMHAELLYHWLGALGLPVPQGLDVVTVPPPMMEQAMAAGEIDAFCVGAPWGSIAVETGVGELLLPGTAIRAFAPEKVLAVRHDWAKAEPDLTRRLMRAVWRAARWTAQRANHDTVSEILSRSDYLDIPAEMIERSLSGRLVISSRGEIRQVPRYIEFHEGAAAYPWRSQGALIGHALAARLGLDRAAAMAAGRRVFRTDLYRENLRDTGAELPGAAEKVEGGIDTPTPAASESGKLILLPDRFFDGYVFDPKHPN